MWFVANAARSPSGGRGAHNVPFRKRKKKMKVRKHPHSMRRYSLVVEGSISGYGTGGPDDTIRFTVQGETHQFEFSMGEEEWERLVETIEEMRNSKRS